MLSTNCSYLSILWSIRAPSIFFLFVCREKLRERECGCIYHKSQVWRKYKFFFIHVELQDDPEIIKLPTLITNVPFSSLLQPTTPQILLLLRYKRVKPDLLWNECSNRALNSAVDPRYKRVKPKSTSLNECNFCVLQLFLTERSISQGTIQNLTSC